MAGYGAVIIAPVKFDNLVATLLQAAQRRAKKISLLHGLAGKPLRMRYRRLPPKGDKRPWAIDIEGTWWEIAVWSQWIERDLPIVAEGYAGGLPISETIKVARSLVAAWHYLIAPEEELPREPYVIQTATSSSNKFQWTIFDWPEDEPLYSRLLISDQILARWYIGDIPEEIALEELHFMLEYLARKITKSGQHIPFPKLVIKMFERGNIEESERDLMMQFNNIRREFRHRGRAIRDDSEREELRSLIRQVLFIAVKLYDCL